MELITVETKCNLCHKAHPMTVPRRGYELWKAGVLIQRALPTLSSDDRERLIGTCPKCWVELFGEDSE